MFWFHNFFAFFQIVILSFFLEKNTKMTNGKNADFSKENTKNLPQIFKKENQLRASQWADSVYNALNTRQRIGQLFIARAYSNTAETKPEKIKELEDLIKNYNIGGLCFFQGTPTKQYELTQKYQKLAKTPMWISIDAEWGLGMRLDSTISFPRAMTLGAIRNADSLVLQMGKEIGKHCKKMGIHINFAPVVDVNNNPKNPVIDRRSFGDNPQKVAQLAHTYAKGLKEEGILAVIKHFPGHGDTEVDSHLSLPKISHTKQRLEEIELFPFQQLINQNIEAIMAGHLHVSALDTIPASISKKILGEILQKKMKFEGLIFSDALEMQGIANHYPNDKFPAGELELRAFQAGIDVLLISNDIPKAITRIEKAFLKNEIKNFEQRIKKILIAKYHIFQQHDFKEKPSKNLTASLNLPESKILQKQLFQKAITVLDNKNNFLPIKELDTLRIASVALGAKEKTFFQQHLDNYAEIKHFFIPKKLKSLKKEENQNNNNQDFNWAEYKEILDKIEKGKFNTIIISLHDLNKKNPNFNITEQEYSFMRFLGGLNKKIIVCGFFSPYALSIIEKALISPTIVWGYEENEITALLVPQVIFGAIGASGKLPVNVGGQYVANMGDITEGLGRINYPLPEETGLSSDSLAKMDIIIKQGLWNKEFPSCQVLVIKKNGVVWQKSYGNFTFSNDKNTNKTVQNNNLYDVASISKVLGTLLGVMYFYDKKQIDLNEKIEFYLPEMKKTNKGKIIIKDLLMHQAGLIPYMRLYERTTDNFCKPSPFFYQKNKTDKFPLAVADNIFARKDMPELMWKWYMDSPITPKPQGKERHKHEYSDLSFYILQRLVEKLANEKLNIFLDKTFYKPLGLGFASYNPLEKFQKNQIIPTEKDTLFRHQLIQGHVHDQGASMMGGLAGHAGLFSNAQNLGILLQMLLNGGEYAGKKYISKETITLFTSQQYEDNRRGLGWDKPDKVDISYIPNIMSVQSFGHSGFTGCVVWADPVQDLAVVFLSNRIHPKVENDKLIKNHTRRKAFNLLR